MDAKAEWKEIRSLIQQGLLVAKTPRQKSEMDAILYGTGYLRVHKDGTEEHIPFEEIVINEADNG